MITFIVIFVAMVFGIIASLNSASASMIRDTEIEAVRAAGMIPTAAVGPLQPEPTSSG